MAIYVSTWKKMKKRMASWCVRNIQRPEWRRTVVKLTSRKQAHYLEFK
jgi:hypothetical protein